MSAAKMVVSDTVDFNSQYPTGTALLAITATIQSPGKVIVTASG